MTLLCLPPCVPEVSRVTLLPSPASALSCRDPAGGAPLSGLRPCLPPPEGTKKASGLKEATASRPQQARLMLPQAGQDPRLHSMFQGRAHQSQSDSEPGSGVCYEKRLQVLPTSMRSTYSFSRH